LRTQGFESEEQLVKAIAASVRLARRRDYRFELEVDAGVGIADIVLTKRARRSTEGLHALGSVSPRLAVLLNQALSKSIKNPQELAACLGSSDTAAQRVITQMSTAGLMKKTRHSLALTTVRTLPFEHLIAVEAKISNWQHVLVQAYRNLQFADESWVVLDHTHIRPAVAQLERFKVAGVGLASVDRTRGLFIHLCATSAGPVSLGKHWQAQAVLAARTLTRRITSAAG
jgi:hypothetical protein